LRPKICVTVACQRAGCLRWHFGEANNGRTGDTFTLTFVTTVQVTHLTNVANFIPLRVLRTQAATIKRSNVVRCGAVGPHKFTICRANLTFRSRFFIALYHAQARRAHDFVRCTVWFLFGSTSTGRSRASVTLRMTFASATLAGAVVCLFGRAIGSAANRVHGGTRVCGGRAGLTGVASLRSALALFGTGC
jgi:hypothetical protein